MKCLKCKHDVSDLINWDTLVEEFIECPNCGNKMSVQYEEGWDEESGYEDSWWVLEQYVY